MFRFVFNVVIVFLKFWNLELEEFVFIDMFLDNIDLGKLKGLGCLFVVDLLECLRGIFCLCLIEILLLVGFWFGVNCNGEFKILDCLFFVILFFGGIDFCLLLFLFKFIWDFGLGLFFLFFIFVILNVFIFLFELGFL